MEVLDRVLAAIGAVLVVLAIVDVVRTVLRSTAGAGPVTVVVNAAIRRAAGAAARLRPSSEIGGGPPALVAMVVTWSVMLVTGFSLLLQPWTGAVVDISTGEPAEWWERVYFVGYSVFTLGNGGYAPTSDPARMFTLLVNASGMFLITMAVTYLLSVVSASVQARAFASSALSLGDAPAEVLVEGWDGRRIDLGHQLRDLSSELSMLAHRHRAYPVLHLFRGPDESASPPRAVALIDDVLTLLDAVEPSVAPPSPARRQLRSSICRYLDTFGVGSGGERPPAPSVDALRAHGIPLAGDGARLDQLLAERDEHRRRVHRLASASAG